MAADPSNKVPSKRSFQLKMCKKVAELTQVVHMLFTKNHEREIEIATMAEEYECEIGKLVNSYQEKIGALTNDVEVIKVTEERARQTIIQNEKEFKFKLEKQKEAYIRELESAKKLKDKLQVKNDKLLKQIKDLEEELSLLSLPRKNSVNHEVEYHDDSNTFFHKPTAKVNREDRLIVERLNDTISTRESSQILNLKKQLEKEKQKHAQEQMYFDHQLEKLRNDLEQMEIQMHKKMNDACRDLMATEGSRDKIVEKNKKLEVELRALNKKIKISQQNDIEKRKWVLKDANYPVDKIEVNEEMERLRQEIKRYKLELSNREGNFNRMFTSTVPVRLDNKTTSLTNCVTRLPSSADKTRISFERLPTLTSEHVRRKTARYQRPPTGIKDQWNTLSTLHS
ncbi:uncharacterized protein [Antedon mediterranea]|uniref:uncharacterized protein n=1 Tax=Antedon mediterranea TaxID=105859 RepID=UPI003AF542BD